MKREGGSYLGFYTIGIAMLFLAGFFLLVVFGARSYRGTVTGQNENMQNRALLSYLQTTVKGYDREDAVQILDSSYGQVLVIADEEGEYALRIYRYEGNLVEDYASADADYEPEFAQVIGQTETFVLEKAGNVLHIATDAGSVLLSLRSEGGAR